MDTLIKTAISFNFYYDVKFWVWFALVAIAFRLISIKFRIKSVCLLFCNSFMLLALPTLNLMSFTFLGFISLCVYLVGYLLNDQEIIKNKSIRITTAFFAISIVIIMLAFFKYSFIQKIFYQEIM